jgi:hypothetical protein
MLFTGDALRKGGVAQQGMQAPSIVTRPTFSLRTEADTEQELSRASVACRLCWVRTCCRS